MIIDITDFDKDQLAELARSTFATELDMRKSLENLKAEVTKLMANKPELKANVSVKKATHLLNRNTGIHFPYTDLLAEHLTNAVACDEHGEPV